ncbi:MAG TPA: chorismate synthase [Firmicutes bacterium]|nr:chorismate synthase [Bacillota bacterium]
MASIWGKQLTISLFGESHGPGIGVVIDGVPPGEPLDMQAISAFIARRAPGRTPWSSQRREPDAPRIISGIYKGQTTGTPLCALIENKDTRPQDYTYQADVLRPSHADFTGMVRYRGASDPRGGGHFSGRLTAPLCFAGAICKQMLERRGITIAARVSELGNILDAPIDNAAPDVKHLRTIGDKDFPVLDDEKGQRMIAAVERARLEGDSLGGIVQCFVLGLPAGVGDPMFGGVESCLASILYGIPAVKAISFGDGFATCRRSGSENNDTFYVNEAGMLRTRTNHEGGINGGITNGMPVVFDVGIKPTPSIALPRQSVNIKTMQAETRITQGRHDPCIVPRAAVAVEAATAVALLDLMLVAYGVQGFCEMEVQHE